MNNKTFLNAPELHIVIVAFFLHFVWELIQTPLYECFRDMHYYTVVLLIIRASLGDVLIYLPLSGQPASPSGLVSGSSTRAKKAYGCFSAWAC